MATHSFRSLTAYQLAASLCDDLTAEVETWPSFEKWPLGRQLVRAAGSVGANIAEATGRWTHGDKRHMLVIARGSLYETEHWYETRIDELRGALTGLMRRPID